MAAAAVRGTMAGLDDSSSDEDDHPIRRRKPGTGYSLAAEGAPTAPRHSSVGKAKDSGGVYDEALRIGTEAGAEEAAMQEAAFARATAAHLASLTAGADETGTDSASSSSKPALRAPGATASSASGIAMAPADKASMRQQLLLPAVPGSGPVQCYVVRTKYTFSNPVFRMYEEGTNRFLLSAQKRARNRTSNYLIAMEDTPSRDSGNVVGKVRANWSGAVYTVYDGGMAPEDAVTDASLRQELAVIAFDWDSMGPGKLRAAVPRLRKSGAPVMFRAREAADSLAAAAAKGDTKRMVMLKNKRPQWDETSKAHVLDFGGRVTETSVKNFQLASDEFGDTTLLQFGRVGKAKFSLDFQSPLSHVQALGIVMAAVDGKIADYKSLKRLAGPTPDTDDTAWFLHWNAKPSK